MRRLLRCRIYNALIRGSADTARTDRKAMPTMQLVGCSMAKLRRHMAAQFSDGMTWAEWQKALGWNDRTFRRKRDELVSSGAVRLSSGCYYHTAEERKAA